MPDANVDFSRALAASLHALGLRDVCISPGSRNTPLTLAFAVHTGIQDWSHHDERSAGFFAIGLAKASGRPVALVCTSGTAAAEYHPAVVEAFQSRVPLLVLTADRPPELRDVGAPQAIDQVKAYGDHVKWSHTGAPPDDTAVQTAPALAAHAWGEAVASPAGPVHLNLPFRDPLVPDTREEPSSPAGPTPSVHTGTAVAAPATVAKLDRILAARKTLFVVGSLAGGAGADQIDALAAALGAVVFADPQSGLRSGARTSAVIASADLLASAGALDTDPPDVVVRWGGVPTSKPVWRWLESHPDVIQVLIDAGGHHDPLATAHLVVRADAATTAEQIDTPGGPDEWAEAWRHRDDAAEVAVAAALSTEAFPNDPAVARLVAAAAPPGATLFTGSSMPIRDVDTFAAHRDEPLTVIANRGANGIDGSISTTLGVAAAGHPCVALIGDVAALHDVGALATMARLRLPLILVIAHNDGGGIFHLLPQADPSRVDPAVFERHIATPHGTDFVAVATALGLPARRVEDAAGLTAHVATGEGPLVLEVRTNRHDLAALRARLRKAVAATLS